MEKQGIKRFFKPVSTNSNVGKETNLVETIASIKTHRNSSKSTETEIVDQN